MDEKPNDNEKVTPIAKTNWRNSNVLFGIKQKDRRSHMYIIGKTGTGKSTLIENMIYSDMLAGNGLALIDPHGDLVENILDLVPENRIDDVIYFNPADLAYPIAFNPLEKVHPDYHHLVASGIVSIFKKIWPDFWGPRLEHILRHAVMTLLEYPDSTLLDLPKLLTDDKFRMEVLKHVTHPQVKEFWYADFGKINPRSRHEAVAPILNKMGQFLISLPLRNIVGQRGNSFDLKKVTDEGKIFLVNLAKGKIGEDNCAILGAMLVTMIWLATLSRTDRPENARRPFYLYVDEVHNFLTLSFADTMSESRKYGLNLILAHQYIDQLDVDIRNAILGNVGTLISFRIGARDAKHIALEFHPDINETDLVNLANYDIYLKMMIDGEVSKMFSATTMADPKMERSYRREIVRYSRFKYGIKRRWGQ
jgi:hypothetical protein